MKLYNTLTKSIDEFTPIDGKTARIYTCGPTVYNHAHIGNLSAYIYADVLRRTASLAGFRVKHVMNFTDVDDKTIRDSRAQFSGLEPMAALEKLTRHYEEIFLDEMEQVGNDVAAFEFVRATENIAEMQNLIRKLLKQKIAYIADDGIYFSIAEYRKTRKYGQLSAIELPTEMKARIDNDEYDKDSAQDFALWKKQKDDEPAWDFKIDCTAEETKRPDRKLKFFIIHGTEGHPKENWFPWLKNNLEELGHEVIVPQFPSPPIVPAKISEWFDVWKKYEDEIDENTVIIGHSLGGMFTLRVLEKLQKPICAAILVASPIGIKPIKFYDRDLAFSGDFEFDWGKIRENARDFVVYHSDNDPYVDMANGRELAKQLGIEMTFVPNAGHFNVAVAPDYIKFPQLLDKIRGIVGQEINLRGRPGWHIECSAMSVKKLGQPFDIHTGGIDLIFPHHENEIAQSTAGDQPERYAKFFVHNEHLLVDGKKMSKSAHNFYTLPDIIEKGFDPLDFRMLVLQSHYRSATNFSWENLEAARNRRKKWRRIVELCYQYDRLGVRFKSKRCRLNDVDFSYVGIYLLHDLNTPRSLMFIDMFLDFIVNSDKIIYELDSMNEIVNFIDGSLGLKLRETTPDISDVQKKMIEERQAARGEKNWAKSDEIRDDLQKQGIILRDLNGATIWSRI